AMDYHTVAHIAFPVDLQSADAGRDKRSKRNIAGHTSDTPGAEVVLPPAVDLKLAAAILNDGKRVAILAGRGALHASHELELTAAMLGAHVVKALLGQAALAGDSPSTT